MASRLPTVSPSSAAASAGGVTVEQRYQPSTLRSMLPLCATAAAGHVPAAAEVRRQLSSRSREPIELGAARAAPAQPRRGRSKGRCRRASRRDQAAGGPKLRRRKRRFSPRPWADRPNRWPRRPRESRRGVHLRRRFTGRNGSGRRRRCTPRRSRAPRCRWGNLPVLPLSGGVRGGRLPLLMVLTMVRWRHEESRRRGVHLRRWSSLAVNTRWRRGSSARGRSFRDRPGPRCRIRARDRSSRSSRRRSCRGVRRSRTRACRRGHCRRRRY